MKQLTKVALSVLPLWLACLASSASAGVYITGSVSATTTNLPYQSSGSQYGSASIDFDLGRYIRLGYTYGLEYQSTKGYKDTSPTGTTDATAENYCADASTCAETYSISRVVENSVGLTIILYEGEVFMPFMLAGGIQKTMTVESQDFDVTGHLVKTPPSTQRGPIQPYVGGGIGIRLNRNFSLKLSYQVSPGVIKKPNEEAHGTWDRRSSVGLTYQL